MFKKIAQIINTLILAIKLTLLCHEVKTGKTSLMWAGFTYNTLCHTAAMQVWNGTLPMDLYKEFFFNHKHSFKSFYEWWLKEQEKIK